MECPACGGESVSAPYPYASFENHLRIPSGAMGLLGPKHLSVGPGLARVCTDCGYVLFFLDKDDLAAVRAALK